MDFTKLHSSWNDNAPFRISKALNFDDLVSAIEYLDEKNIISFNSFSALSALEVKDKYFGMAHPTSIKKAIIKIRDKRDNKIGPSSLTTVTETFTEKGVKKVVKTDFF